MKKKLVALAAAATLALAACGSDSKDNSGASGADSYNIGVTQIVTHAALDAAVDGFKAAISDAGLDVTYNEQNANNDQTVVASIAGSMAGGDYDLVLGVGTPMAQGLAQAITTTPVLFTAVTDPVGAGLVANADAPGANITGTTDANPVREQLELVKEIVPDAKTVGIIYHSGEANSQVQADWVAEAAGPLGLTVKEATVINTSEVQQAADSLDVDAIYIPTDNTVISALDSVLQVGETKKIPVFVGEGDSVKSGALATYGIAYYELGYQTGEMAVRILTEGADPATMAVEAQKEPVLYINTSAAERMGVTFPDSVLERAKPENTFK
ncbi:ABC-type uncharacterized transport system, periplasmic component [Trueperella bialowiezensis]|uniref:ABC-type uncharacterized transport system, periplasmic component n=2 Tax=Trueperella bialowiezensis TaxID=312285 RepID=A0A3S4WFY2_9ACTO|nr:ABC-type uncharacterized transport system, periplasmic component [Trueperella bialowiezensis]